MQAGVFGGCTGRLFDFAAADVEQLVQQGDDSNLHEGKPLLSLAIIGCYVLQTLAQHTVIEMAAWVEMANELMMMVRLGGPHSPCSTLHWHCVCPLSSLWPVRYMCATGAPREPIA